MPEKTILLVDSDITSLNFLARILREGNYIPLEVSSGKEGLISAWRDRPDLIVFDPAIQDISTEEFLQKLRRDPRSAGIPILALSSDPGLERETACLQAGCNEYILKSGEAVAEIPAIIARLFGEKQELVKSGGFLLVFLSAKGGTGTSSLCANLAMAICNNKPEASVAVVDMVLPIGSIAPIVGYEGGIDIISVADLSSVTTTEDYFRKKLPKVKQWMFQLLAGSPDPERASHLKVVRIPEIIKTLQKVYDYVVVDLGRSLAKISLPIIQRADLLMLTVSTDKSTVTLTRKVWEYLQAKDIDSKNVYAILNRAVGLEGLTKTEAEEIIGLPIKTVIPYLGSNFALANNLNQPIITKYPTDTAAIVFRNTANDVISLTNKLRMR